MKAIQLSIEQSDEFYIKPVDVQGDDNYSELFDRICTFVLDCYRAYDKECAYPTFAELPFDTVIQNPFHQDGYGEEMYPTHDILGLVGDVLYDFVEHLVKKGIICKELRMEWYNLIDIKETKGLDIIHFCVEVIPDE